MFFFNLVCYYISFWVYLSLAFLILITTPLNHATYPSALQAELKTVLTLPQLPR